MPRGSSSKRSNNNNNQSQQGGGGGGSSNNSNNGNSNSNSANGVYNGSSNGHNSNGNSLGPPSKRQQGRSRSSSTSTANATVSATNVSSSAASAAPSQVTRASTMPREHQPKGGSGSTTQQKQKSNENGKAGRGSSVSTAAGKEGSNMSNINNSNINNNGNSKIKISTDSDGGSGTDYGKTNGESHRKIDINPGSDIKAVVSAPDPSASNTIIASWPLVDSIMLLIVLLQLPSTLLTMVHFLFASLTFVPPNITLLSASSPSINFSSIASAILQGSNGGPSILTIIISDCFVALIGLFLWPAARFFMVDLAQAVIAISLGAGSSTGNGGAFQNVAVCASVVGISQILREKEHITQMFGIPLHAAGPAAASGAPELSVKTLKRPITTPGAVRSAIAVHILAQGIMRATRRWLMIRDPLELPTSSAPSSSSAQSLGASAGTNAKSGQGTSTPNQSRDPEAAGALVPVTDTTKNRKSKKQGQWIRSQQPLWAALASTIVHLKEAEKTQASSASGDPRSYFLEGIDPESEARVWITKIGATEIEFGSNYHPLSTSEGGSDESIDKLFPFSVELNGIKWPQTTISKSEGSGDDSTTGRARDEDDEWRAEIWGLTPKTEYDISFLRKRTGEVIYTTSACTTSKLANPDTAEVTKPSRPLSPITTLLNSLEAAKSTLEDQKRKLKVSRKTNGRRISSLRSEIDSMKSRLGSGDKGDERARRRALSLKESVRRAQEDTESFQMELQTLDELPEDQLEEWKEKKRLWEEERETLALSEREANNICEAADRRIAEVKTEVANLHNKKEKATTKKQKLQADLERAKAEDAAAALEQEKQIAREKMIQKRQAIEAEFSSSINKMEKGLINFRNKTRENYAHLRAFESSMALQHQQTQNHHHPMMHHQMSPPPVMGAGHDMPFPPHHHPHHPALNMAAVNTSPRSNFVQHQTSPIYGPFPPGHFGPHHGPPVHSFHSLNSPMGPPPPQQQQQSIFNGPNVYPPFLQRRARSSSMFSNESGASNLSDLEIHRQPMVPEKPIGPPPKSPPQENGNMNGGHFVSINGVSMPPAPGPIAPPTAPIGTKGKSSPTKSA